MSTLESIIEWAQNELKDWQSDAVRRLLIQGQLTDSDKAEILAMLKEHHGLGEPGKPSVKPQPLKKGDLSGAPQMPVTVTLKAMKDLHNVNAIPDGSCLLFGHQGLTVIYGENATGKSGYARVLKRACKARDVKERLLPNAFGAISLTPASATFKISVNNGKDDEVLWEDGHEEGDILANICVFDSKCARIIVDENNEPVYLPYGADVFEGLVTLLREFHSQLEHDKPRPKKLEYPDILPATKAAQFISQLTFGTPVPYINEQTTWVEGDDAKLRKLETEIATAEAQDPQKQVQRIRNLKDSVDRVLDRIVKVEWDLSEFNANGIKQAITNLNAAESALAIASRSLADEPLPGAGSNAWQFLYNAAKEYSTKLAYPGQDFPMLGDDALCVLCMQPLQDDAKSRMLRFKAFMEDTTKKQVDVAQQQINGRLRELKEIEFPPPATYKDVLDEIRSRNPELAKQIEEFFPAMEARASDLIQAIDNKELRTLSPIKLVSMECLITISHDLEEEARGIEETAKPEELGKRKAERDELQARKLLASRGEEILDCVERLKTTRKYEQCIEETEHRDITERGREIISGALTSKLREALNTELESLNAGYLPLDLRPSGRKGETRHKMELEGCQLSEKTHLTDILSEGEQHVVAIAGFLAELEVRNHKCPIVLDDPVCSLDHHYREKIAERLAREAANRQVIVFTHDIAFLLELEDKSAELGTLFYPQTVLRGGEKPGLCLSGLPWHAMKVGERLEYLVKELDEIEGLYPGDLLTYNNRASNLYGLLRKTWEAFVEEILLNKTIIRHGSEVQTQRLKSVTVTNDDYRELDLGMHKCSIYMGGHDKSKALDANMPSPSEIRKDIQALQQFKKSISQRNDKLRKEREEALEPPKPQVG